MPQSAPPQCFRLPLVYSCELLSLAGFFPSLPGLAGPAGGVQEGTANKTDKRMSREGLPEMSGGLSRGLCPKKRAPCSLPETGSVWGWLPCLAP